MKDKAFYRILFILFTFLIFFLIFSNKSFASTSINCTNDNCSFVFDINTNLDLSTLDFNVGDRDNDIRHISNIVLLSSGSDVYAIGYFYYGNNYATDDKHNNYYKLCINDNRVPYCSCYVAKIYKYIDNKFVYQGYTGSLNDVNDNYSKLFSYPTILASSSNIYTDTSYENIYFDCSRYETPYFITLSTTAKAKAPIIFYSNYFDYADAKKYEVYISTNAKTWTLMNYETFNDTVNNVTKFRFNYKIYENGCYYFKFVNTDENNSTYLSYNVFNILKDENNSGVVNDIPQAFCTYERVNDKFIIKTQNFSFEDIQKYNVIYNDNNNFNEDYSTWDKMSIGTYNNTVTGETSYYYFFTVPADSEDCTFYFRFYDINQNKYGEFSSMNCFFDEMNEYYDNLYGVSSEASSKKNKINELLEYFKERFGFLTYPFEFLVDFFNRILNINYSEPVIHIPELREPFGNNKIFNGFEFNFNSLLTNNTFSYLYNIYLIAVDFVIIVLFIFLCKKVIEEVFGNG